MLYRGAAAACFCTPLVPLLLVPPRLRSPPRLTAPTLFPHLHPNSNFTGGPSWLQWGFACVRSRAFELRKDCFAFVPFLDGANHAADPSCDFR